AEPAHHADRDAAARTDVLRQLSRERRQIFDAVQHAEVRDRAIITAACRAKLLGAADTDGETAAAARLFHHGGRSVNGAHHDPAGGEVGRVLARAAADIEHAVASPEEYIQLAPDSGALRPPDGRLRPDLVITEGEAIESGAGAHASTSPYAALSC